MDERNIKLKSIWEDFVKEIEERGKPTYFQNEEGTHIEDKDVGKIPSRTHWSVVMVGPEGCYDCLKGNLETEFREEAEKYSDEKFHGFKEAIGEVYYKTPKVVLDVVGPAYKTKFFTRITMNQLIKKLEDTKADDYITDTVRMISEMTIKAFPYVEFSYRIEEGNQLSTDSTVNLMTQWEPSAGPSFQETLLSMHQQLERLGFEFMKEDCSHCKYYVEGGFESKKI